METEVRRGRRAVRLTGLERVWWPDEGIRKLDVVEYYAAVAPVLLPHLRDRPFTVKRHYTGPRSPFAWVKDAPPELPDWVPTSRQPARSRRGALVRYPLVNDELALLWMVEFGCVDLHVWSSRVDRPDRPDFVLFDLDPAGVPFADAAQVAVLLRDALAALGLVSVAMTTGGEGLHVRVPIARRHRYDDVRSFTEVVTGALRRAAPDLVTTERSPSRRRGVFVDTKMNGRGQQIVAPYSVRPLPGGPVAAPARWEELEAGLERGELTMARARERVERDGDLLEPLLRGRQRLDRAVGAVG